MVAMSAWAFTYRRGLDGTHDPRKAAGIRAMKQELILNGFSEGILIDLPVFGSKVTARTREFQQNEKITIDGEIGPQTAARLFRKRCALVEQGNGPIPDSLLCRLKQLESASDPVAEGVADPNDEGLVQVNMPSHPTLMIEQLWDPAFVLPWAGDQLAQAHASIQDWDGAIAAWNVGGFYARLWVKAGKPDSGHTVGTIDWFARAHKYVQLVHNAKC